MLTVEDGSGIVGADSYLSVEAADEYHAGFGNDDWALLDEGQKEILLRRATRDIDLLYKFVSTKVSTDQALAWPRYAIDGVPTAVVNATAELALISAEYDATGADDGEGNIQTIKTKVDVLETQTTYFAPRGKGGHLRKIGMLLQGLLEGSSSSLYAKVVRG